MAAIHVACAADAAYLPHAAAMLRSLFARHPGATAHLLHAPSLPAVELGKLRRMCEQSGATLRAHVIDDAAVADLPEMGRISRVMWYRLFLPERLPDVERVLYLDCDTLVLDSLDPLFETALGASALGAVANVFERGMEARVQALGLKGYFNSGVLLMDLDAWRRERLTEAVLSRARAGDLVWPDQDALNVVFDGRWLALHPRWNCQNSIVFFPQARAVFGADAVADAVRNPAIVHFEGGALAKPWHYLCKHPRRHEYFRWRSGTPWPSVAIEGRTPANRVLRLLPTPWIVRALRVAQRLRQAAFGSEASR